MWRQGRGKYISFLFLCEGGMGRQGMVKKRGRGVESRLGREMGWGEDEQGRRQMRSGDQSEERGDGGGRRWKESGVDLRVCFVGAI